MYAEIRRWMRILETSMTLDDYNRKLLIETVINQMRNETTTPQDYLKIEKLR